MKRLSMAENCAFSIFSFTICAIPMTRMDVVMKTGISDFAYHTNWIEQKEECRVDTGEGEQGRTKHGVVVLEEPEIAVAVEGSR